MLLLWYTPPRKGIPKPLYSFAVRRNYVETRYREEDELLALYWWLLITGDIQNG